MAFETPSTPESAASGNYARSCGIALHRGHYKLNILEVCWCLHGARLQQFSIWVSVVCIHTELSSAVGNYKFSRETKSMKWFPQGNTVTLHLAGANTHLKTGICSELHCWKAHDFPVVISEAPTKDRHLGLPVSEKLIMISGPDKLTGMHIHARIQLFKSYN